jgi:hypothetical protein
MPSVDDDFDNAAAAVTDGVEFFLAYGFNIFDVALLNVVNASDDTFVNAEIRALLCLR